ncbi:MAG: hypothetical protein Tsb0021_02680 [Chlamydiales bacterium]
MSYNESFKSLFRKGISYFTSLFAPAEDTNPRILCYHGIDPNPKNPWCISPIAFKQQMHMLKEHYNPITIDEAVEYIQGKKPLLPKSVAITFDDGFADSFIYADPILKEYSISSAVFIITQFTDPNYIEGSSLHAKRQHLSWDQLKKMRDKGWIIGSHTRSHPTLSSLSINEIESELRLSKEILEQKLEVSIKYLAYPYGTPHTVSEEAKNVAKKTDYRAAFMNILGHLSSQSDLFSIPRCKVLRKDSLRVVQASLNGHLDLWKKFESLK